MYKITVVFRNKTFQEFENIESIRIGRKVTDLILSEEQIKNLLFDDQKPIYLFGKSKSYLIPEKSFNFLTVEKTD